MEHTTKFIEDAIEGGWRDSLFTHNPKEEIAYLIEDGYFHRKIGEILIDPLVWQAVGKVRGWRNPESRSHHITATDMETSMQVFNGVWMQNWQDFIQWLADGKTTEEALEAISE